MVYINSAIIMCMKNNKVDEDKPHDMTVEDFIRQLKRI